MHSGEYVDDYERKPISRIARLVPRMALGNGEELADFACGNAMLLPVTYRLVKHYHGVDFSPDFIAAAKRRAQSLGADNATFYCQDIIDFCGARPEAFDVATALDFSEHIDDDDFVAIFSAIRSSLRPNGRLYLHTPNLTFFLELLKQRGILRQFPQHIAVRDAGHNVRLLERCGFGRARIKVDEIPHYNVMRAVHPLRAVPGIGKFFAARLFVECRK
ncbi:class I SAM-dependent methyltransferase [Luteimonas sp. SX5]|uniref:Class I SAM-dependent methyltransferase n=2 Tax=Luteimonas galliterrae TaxID=2940486 RepID=A0ABT0MIE0_9GAMM|nr:class I SAM-dependent methyltransferase [Luteimonas galliterrae]